MITPERWQRVKAIFLSAQSSAPAERAAFLDQACNGDEVIRGEVESLLAADSTNDDFLSTPAYELAAEMLADEKPEFVAGQTVGPYAILSLLGTGGMGEVYLAHDARLDRQIALKVISPNFARDEARVRRFDQEARAASALNHPNVCVIHEVGTTKDGRHFMAMEFIDGVTLRRRMSQRKLTLKEVLDVAAQVAWALEAAHAASIVHRDIKPENIMVRRDGYVKVLDFGIAKLSAHSSRLRNVHDAETTARFDTSPGVLVGTAKYMSPEQLRERPVDQRSDIWSLGVVLHEMVTGFTPFEAHTTNETIAVILEKQPAQLNFDSDKVPEEFQQLVRKALSKKRRERYQNISQLSSDLSKLRRQLSVQALDKPLELPTRPLQTDVDNSVAEARSVGAVSTILSRVGSQAVWTADYVLSEIKQHKTAAFMGATVVLVMLFLVIPRQPPPATITMTRLTNSGKTVCAAISPDGDSVAHVEDRNGKQVLLVTNTIPPGEGVIVPAGDFSYRGVTFSPDGRYLYFVRRENNEAGILYQVALPGGAPRKIKEGVDSPISFSPQGDRFAFVRSDKSKKEFFLLSAAIDGSEEQTLLSKKDGKRLSVSGPAWSPDGKTVACAAGSWDNTGYHMNLIETGVEYKSETVIGRNQWYSVLQVAWLEDRSGLVISAKEQALSPYQLWRISYPQGEAVRITDETIEYKSVSLSRNGDTIAPIQTQQNAKIWVGPAGDSDQSRVILSTTGRNYGLDWTSKGKIVYSSMVGNNLNISMIDPDNSSPTQLTEKGDNYSPVVSRDGRYIVFTSNRNGSLNIWRMNADDGSEQTQLTFGGGNSYPGFSADHRWVVYDNLSNPKPTAWKVSIDVGEPIQLADACARMPVVSPNNQLIACRSIDEANTEDIAVLPFVGGPLIRRVPIGINDWQRVQWTSDSRALTYINASNGADNIWRYDLQSETRKQLTDFKTDKIFAYAWTPDHKQLASVRGLEIRNVVTITNWK
jgi:serine/threonine protein kinase/Tol biopolymer transport system component